MRRARRLRTGATAAVLLLAWVGSCSTGAGDTTCVIMCAADAPECRADSYPTYQAWHDMLATCPSPAGDAVTGACSSGTRFVLTEAGGAGEVRFFGSAGGFVARTTLSEVMDGECRGHQSWPVRLPCPNATVAEVLCGTFFHAGDRITW